MKKILLCLVGLGLLSGLGIIVGCFIHAHRVNQTTLMSGVAFVRELPYGEQIVGLIETTVFSYQEKRNLEAYQQQHKGNIQINEQVLKQHKELYRDGSRK